MLLLVLQAGDMAGALAAWRKAYISGTCRFQGRGGGRSRGPGLETWRVTSDKEECGRSGEEVGGTGREE